MAPRQASAFTFIPMHGLALMPGQAEYRFVLFAKLRHQPGFPGQVLFHRLAIAGMPVMYEEQVVDALVIGRNFR